MVKVTIKDNSGSISAQFDGNTEEALGTQAQDEGAPIPFSCGVGACRTCVCKIEKGAEYVDKEAVGPMHIMVEEDEMLSCIGGIKPEAPAEAVIELKAENL